MKWLLLGWLLCLEATAGPRLLMHTMAGDLLLELDPDLAPKHTQQLLKLVVNGVYDGVHFHRAEPGFVLQLSNATDRLIPLNQIQKGLIRNLPLEVSAVKHRRGVLSMARWEDRPDSAQTSFSILLGDAPHLDGKYTVIGRVLVGMDVVDELVAVPKDQFGKPVLRLGVSHTELVPPGKSVKALSLLPAIALSEGARTVARETWFADGAIRLFQITLALCLILSVVGTFLSRGSSLRPLWLSVATVCVFPWFCLALSFHHHSPWIGLGLFVVLIGYFKVMSGFEWARSKAPRGEN